MNALVADLRYALRGLRRSPLFATVAVLSLALGIGANTAIFTLLDQVLLRKLPVKDPNRIVMVYQQGANMGSNMGPRMHSYPLYQDLQQKGEPFSEVICRRIVPASVAVDNQTERVEAELVSGNYFTALGVGPAIGRVFNSHEDDQVYRGHPERRDQLRLLGQALRARSRRRRQEDPRQRLPDDDRRRVGRRIRGARSDGVAADPRADPDERHHDARHRVAASGRSPRALGAGVRAPQAGLHGGVGAAAGAGSLHANPRVRNDAAGGEGLVVVFARAVHERETARHGRVARIFAAAQRLFDRPRGPDVHGRSRAAHRVRQRREPADRAGLRAPARNRRFGCRWARRAGVSSVSCSSKVSCCPPPAACSGSASRFC